MGFVVTSNDRGSKGHGLNYLEYVFLGYTPVNQHSNGKSTMNEDVSPIKTRGFPVLLGGSGYLVSG